MVAPPDRAEAYAADPPPVVPVIAAPAAKRRLARLLAMPRRDPFAFVGILIYAVFVFVAIFADQLATHDPLEILYRANGRVATNMPADSRFLLGTTNLGRDIFSQLVFGTRSGADRRA